MTTAKKTNSTNPATAAAKKRADIEAEAAARAAQEERIRKAREDFENMVLPAPVLDEDGYEVIPDRSALEGGSYKFKLAGNAYVLPNLQYLPISLAQSLTRGTEAEANAAIFGRYAPGVLEHASADQLMHIIKRWKDHSAGVGLGE